VPRRNDASRRTFLRAMGAASAFGLASLSGCTMLAGSQSPSMGFMQDVSALKMFKGAPAKGNYPAREMTMTMEGMEMQGVMVKLVAKPDDSNNYHFMPHVAWVKPGTQVIWGHADIQGVSEPRAHTTTAFGAGNQFPRLIPDGVSGFDSGFIPGLHGAKSVKEGIDHRFNGRISERIANPVNGESLPDHRQPVPRGPFTYTFEKPGVYFYYCQNHHQFKMAGAVVVGPYYGEHGDAHDSVGTKDPPGWAPAMTLPKIHDKIHDADELHGEALAAQVEELRGMIHGGGEGMGGHGGGGH
jgi:plastocyanin